MDVNAGVMFVNRTPVSAQILDQTHSRLTTVRLVLRDDVSLREFRRFLRLCFLTVRRVRLERRPPLVDGALTFSTTAVELEEELDEADSGTALAEEFDSVLLELVVALADELDFRGAAYNTVDNFSSNPD